MISGAFSSAHGPRGARAMPGTTGALRAVSTAGLPAGRKRGLLRNDYTRAQSVVRGALAAGEEPAQRVQARLGVVLTGPLVKRAPLGPGQRTVRRDDHVRTPWRASGGIQVAERLHHPVR